MCPEHVVTTNYIDLASYLTYLEAVFKDTQVDVCVCVSHRSVIVAGASEG